MTRAVIAAALAVLLPLVARALPPEAPKLGYRSCRDRGAQQAPGQPEPLRQETARRSLADEDVEELASSIRVFEAEAKEYRREVRSLVEKKYEDKRRFLSNSYEQGIRDLEVHERKERQDAIAQFEEFLARYPADPAYTPDAMFRLAELYYERSNDEFNQAVAAWRGEVTKAIAEGVEPPPEPSKSYAKSIDVYQQLVTGYPTYRFLDGITYLLAYCLGEMGQAGEALRTYQALIGKYPRSPFVPEAWVRIGDAHFDGSRPGSLPKAAEAFSKMYSYPEHPLYARAIYKLGWTYYRMDDYRRAVESFTKLLDHYVEESRKTGKKPGGDVWPEAVQYIAISLADDPRGGVERAQSWFASIGGRPYEAEVYTRLGDVLFDRTRYAQAAATYELVVAKDPLAPDAPRVQAKIVQAWTQERRLDEEARERERFVVTYDEQGAWWQRNKKDPDLTQEVRSLSESSLMRAASFHHAQAQALKGKGKLEEALREYREAAKAYGLYLDRWPHAKSAYELSYQYADCLYNSLEFERAARTYAAVRDDTFGDKFAAEAALSAVISWEGEVTRLQRAGQLPERKVVLSKDRVAGEIVKPEPLPQALQGLVRESDAFLEKLPSDPKAAAIGYKAGEVFYTHNDYGEARCRFEEVVARWPETEAAQYAANLIIESYLTMRDWAAVEQAAARLQQHRVGKNPKLAATLQRFKLGGRFNRAMQLMEQKSWDEAAQLFTALVAEDPKHEFADKALYNAASCHESARRFESALRLYERIHAEYPKSSFADEALFRVAYNAENTYDFEKAVDRYQLLVDKYPKSKQCKDAIYNAARSLENLQRYDAAAKAFTRYSQLYPGAEDAASTQFHAALIYEKTREWRREIQALQEFVRRFARSKESELVVQAHLKIALAHKALGEEKRTQDECGAAVAEFARRGLRPEAHPRAAAAAAEARFRLAEYDFERYDRIALPASTNPKKLKKALEAKLAEARSVGPQYEDVKKYKRPDWTLAAFYRQAYLLERLAQTLYDAPVPPEFKRPGKEEYLAAYQDQLAQFAQPYEDKAVEVYVQAVQAARELHVKNEWTKKIGESLARYRPREYPVLKDPKGQMLLEDLSPAPLADSPDGAKKRSAPPVKEG